MPAKKQSHLPDDYTHLEDMAMKTAAQYFGDELLVFFGVQQKVRSTAVLPR